MLFDLRSPGRRAAVKVVYIFLAIIMGAGLVFFGIGGNTNGGLFDALSHPFGIGADDNEKPKVSEREKKLIVAVRKNPNNAASWVQLTKVRVQDAQSLGEYNDKTQQVALGSKSKDKLRDAAKSWQSYLALKPKKIDTGTASLMVYAFGPNALNQPAKAAVAQEIIAKARPTANNYANVALFAWLGNQNKKGDAAAKKAVALTPKKQRAAFKKQLDNIKAQIILQNAKKNSSSKQKPADSQPKK